MRSLEWVRPGARTLLLTLVFCAGLTAASHAATLMLDFDIEPNGDPMPLGSINDSRINGLFDYVGVNFSFEVRDENGLSEGVQNDHLCDGSTPWNPADVDGVWAGPPRSSYGDETQNVISPCRPTQFPDYSAGFGELFTHFDRPVVKMCVDYLFATDRGVDPYIEAVDGGADSGRIFPAEEGVLCAEGSDISETLVSIQSGRIVLDNFEITYDPDLIDFDLDPDGLYIGGNDADVSERINETYESLGVGFWKWDGADCGESESVSSVYVRNERAGDDIGSSANTVTLNASGDVPMNSSDGWIEADLSNAVLDDVVCIDFSVDGSGSGQATLSAFDAGGGSLDSDTQSLPSGDPDEATLCVQAGEIECVRFRANSGSVYFDNLVVEGLPEPASGLLGLSSILVIAGLSRTRARSID